MKMMRRFTYALAFLVLAGLGFAQTGPQHNVTVTVPPFLKVQINASNVIFDFSDQDTGNATLTVGNTVYKRASYANYLDFVSQGNPTTQTFAYTKIEGQDPNNPPNHVNLTVYSNRDAWTVKVTPSGNLDSPLTISRIKVYAVKDQGSGSSQTGNGPVPLSTNGTNIAKATSGGRGVSQYHVYYLLEMDVNDPFPAGGYQSQVALEYSISSP